MIYRFLRFLFGTATRAFFKDISLEHFERIPEEGPVLLLPNHPNGLIDPFLILIHMKRPVSLTAKSTLKKNPFLALLFRLGGVVALHRRQDAGEGADPAKNAAALLEARQKLMAGGAVCLFPEGISHDLPQIQPLKTGAARIALEYVDIDGNPGGLKVIPVGIEYMDKDSFRSEAVLRVAEPIDAGAWRAAHPQADAHALMDEVEARLRQSTLNFGKREDSEALSFAAQLALTQGREPVRLGDLGAEAAALVAKTEALQDRYESLRQSHGPELEALGARVRAYRGRLQSLGIHPREVFIELSFGKALLFCIREFGALLLGLPLAAWGLLNHLPPYLFCVAVKRLFGKERDVRATYAIFGAVLAFPVYYLIASSALFRLLPWGGAALWLASLPLSGWAALRYRDHFILVARRSLTFLKFVAVPGLRRGLVKEGQSIVSSISALSQAS